MSMLTKLLLYCSLVWLSSFWFSHLFTCYFNSFFIFSSDLIFKLWLYNCNFWFNTLLQQISLLLQSINLYVLILNIPCTDFWYVLWEKLIIGLDSIDVTERIEDWQDHVMYKDLDCLWEFIHQVIIGVIY